jgi:hypothetical protein
MNQSQSTAPPDASKVPRESAQPTMRMKLHSHVREVKYHQGFALQHQPYYLISRNSRRTAGHVYEP